MELINRALISTTTTIVLLLLAIISDGKLVNKTIDDDNVNNSNGANVTYDGQWIRSTDCGITISTSVDICSQEIDMSRATDATWTGMVSDTSDNIADQEFTMFLLTFNGTAIYVYHIIPAIDDTLPSNYSIYYALDAAPFTSLTYTKTSETQYNQLLFSREGLNDTSHAFYVQPVGNNKQVIFDYALHTIEDGTPSAVSSSTSSLSSSISSRTTTTSLHPSSNPQSTSKSSIALIVGAVLGATGGLICVLMALMAIIRRRKNKRSAENRDLLKRWISTKDDLYAVTLPNTSTSTQPQAADYPTSRGMTPYILAYDMQSTPSPVQAGVTVGSKSVLPVGRSPLSTLSVQLLTGKQGPSQQAHIVEHNAPESNAPEANVGQLNEPGANHRTPHLSDEISAGENREVGSEGTVERAYVVMLETEVDRLQTQLDQMMSDDIPPSYYTSSGNDELSVVHEGRSS